MLNAGRQTLAFLAVTGTTLVVVDASSRTVVFPAFDYPGGAVLIYGLSMTLVWLTRRAAPFAFPDAYYRLRRFEHDGRLYRRLGVAGFRRLLMATGIERLNVSARLSHGRTGLQRFARGTRDAETDHAIVLLVMVVTTGYAAASGWWALAGWLLLTNLVANVYPIMLQRHNRGRLLPLLERLGGRDRRH